MHKKTILSLCSCLITFVLLATSVDAISFDAEITPFSESFTLQTGDVFRDKRVLLVVCGEADEIDQILSAASLSDFSPYQTDMSFQIDPDSEITLLAVMQDTLQGYILHEAELSSIETEMFSAVSFETFDAGTLLAISPSDIIAFKTGDHEVHLVGITGYDGGLAPIGITVKQYTFGDDNPGIPGTVPEPTSIILVITGMLALFGIMRSRCHS